MADPVYRCARCGIRIKKPWIYSSWTGSRYCIDQEKCRRRLKRRPKRSTI